MSDPLHASAAPHARRGLQATSGERDLLLRLDAWCRQHGQPSAGNRAIAVAALRDADSAHRWREVSIAGGPQAPGGRPLGPAPRRWPPAARYRLAELERDGLGRRSALREVRAEQTVPGELERAHTSPDGAADTPLRRPRAGRPRRTGATTGRPVTPRSSPDVG